MRGTAYPAVALGSALGAMARYLASTALPSTAFPWATLAVNLLGSALIGWVSVATAPGGRWEASDGVRHFLMGGFCGGFTTFSIFSLEAVALGQRGAYGTALGYVALSLLLWLTGVWLGCRAGARL